MVLRLAAIHRRLTYRIEIPRIVSRSAASNGRAEGAEELMEPGCLPFTEVPHTTTLFADFTTDFERVKAFYPLAPQNWAELAKFKRADYPADRRKAVAEVLLEQNGGCGASQQTLANIEKLRTGACAIVTGQQVSLFGGPAFSIYKAITAVRLARELSQRGCECVPIFWLATQDHDFAEVSSATLRSPDGELERVVLQPTAAEGTPVGRVQLNDRIEDLLKEAERALGPGAALSLLRESYRTKETLGSAMARLFAKLFSEFGLIVIDPMQPALQRTAAPMYAGALNSSEELSRSLLDRGKKLEHAGYHQQVKVTASSTLLFVETNGVRTPLRKLNGGFAAGEKRFTQQEVEKLIGNSPEQLSGNALLRPVMQDYLLPTLAYVGGPAEVAYFAQAAVVYEKLLGRVTPIVPRLSATLLDARDQRLLKRYKAGVKEIFQHGAKLGEFLASRSLPLDVEHKFRNAEQAATSSLKAVQDTLQQLDSTLAESAQLAATKIQYQLHRLQERASRALLRRNEEIQKHAVALSNSILPSGHLQEREIAGISYIARYPELLNRLYDAARPGCLGHHVLSL